MFCAGGIELVGCASDDAVLLITDNATGVGKAFGDGADDLIAAISYPSLLKHG